MIAALVALVVVAAPAGAEPALDWRAPLECPTAEVARARIEQRLGHAVDEFVVALSVEIAREGELVARVAAGTDVRELRATSCDELVDAIAIIAARLVRDRARTPGPPAERIAHPGTAPPDEWIADPGADAGRPWNLNLRVSAVSGRSVVPGVAGEIAVAVRRRALFGELAQTYGLHAYDEAAADVAFDITSARFGWRPIPLRAWLTVEAGTLRTPGDSSMVMSDGMAAPITLADPVTTSRWLAAGAGIGYEWQLGAWSRIVAMTEAVVHANRVLDTAPGSVSVRAGCGLELGW